MTGDRADARTGPTPQAERKVVEVYDAAPAGAPFVVVREDGETDERFARRTATLALLFPARSTSP